MENHVKNKKYGNFVSISSLTGECAAEKLKNFCSSSLWTCLHHMVILGSNNKITNFLMILAWACPFNPSPAKLIYLNFQPLEVVSRYCDPQLQVGENYSYLFNLRPNIFKSWCLNPNFIPNIKQSRLKTIIVVISMQRVKILTFMHPMALYYFRIKFVNEIIT